MKRFITMGSISQFRQTIKDVQHQAQYRGFDQEKQVMIMDRFAVMPIVNATASEKVHGTNAAVCYSNSDGIWYQSRKNIITPEKDNAACAFQADQRKESWMEIIQILADHHEINLDTHIISVFYEWAGGNIQKNSALSGLDKRAMIFQYFKVSPIEPQIGNDGAENPESAKWLETIGTDAICEGKAGVSYLTREQHDIYNIMNFPTWEFTIDFNEPLLSQNKLIKLVEETVELNSPLGKVMGEDGNIGEGIVVTFKFDGVVHRFKVKGEKHSSSKVKTLKPVDDIKEQAKIEFANYASSSARLEQAWQTVFGIENEVLEPSVKATGDFLKAVIADVMKEEQDVMADRNLEPKEVNGMISKVSRIWFMEQLDKEAGL